VLFIESGNNGLFTFIESANDESAKKRIVIILKKSRPVLNNNRMNNKSISIGEKAGSLCQKILCLYEFL